MLSLARQSPIPFPGPDGRRLARKSMFVAAVLQAGAQSLGVKIRNMSPTGVLLEGAVLPPPGSRIELLRGPLRATGCIAWAEGGRCGVALEGRIEVDCWLSGKAPSHQALVDAMVEEVKRDLDALAEVEAPLIEPESGAGRGDVAAAVELDQIIGSLAALGDRLTDDPLVVAGHMMALQAIDEAQQRLAALKLRLA